MRLPLHPRNNNIPTKFQTMKKMKSIFATMLLSIVCVAVMSSCSDNEDEPSIPAAKSVEGIYKGEMTCTAMETELVFDNITMTVTAADESSVNIEISTFGNPPMQIPGLTIRAVKVSGADGRYTLADTEFSGTTDTGKAYSGILRGSFENNSITIGLNLQYGAMPMPMICSFTAPKQ